MKKTATCLSEASFAVFFMPLADFRSLRVELNPETPLGTIYFLLRPTCVPPAAFLLLVYHTFPTAINEKMFDSHSIMNYNKSVCKPEQAHIPRH